MLVYCRPKGNETTTENRARESTLQKLSDATAERRGQRRIEIPHVSHVVFLMIASKNPTCAGRSMFYRTVSHMWNQKD